VVAVAIASGTPGTLQAQNGPPAQGQKPAAQTPEAPAPAAQAPAAKPGPPPLPAGVATPADYTIGPEDVLSVLFWRDKDMSSDVTVRPDGKISLLLVNDIQAAGLTVEQLRVAITEAATKFVDDPTVSVVVKQINSRRVYILGQVSKPGTYPLGAPTTVLQLIAQAGNVLEYADSENITVQRTENGKPVSIKVNYKDLLRARNLQQNILLKPGDTVVVP
jgi:polysaccharide export outer membrane protein